jgi:hypothetical protein
MPNLSLYQWGKYVLKYRRRQVHHAPCKIASPSWFSRGISLAFVLFCALILPALSPTPPIKLPLCTPLRHRGCEATAPLINLTLELYGEKWSASCPGHFTPSRRAPSTHRIRGTKGPRVDVETSRRETSLVPAWNQTRITRSPRLYPTSLHLLTNIQ